MNENIFVRRFSILCIKTRPNWNRNEILSFFSLIDHQSTLEKRYLNENDTGSHIIASCSNLNEETKIFAPYTKKKLSSDEI